MQFCDFASFGADPTMNLRVQADFETNTHTPFAPNSGSKSAGAPCKNVPKSKIVNKKPVSVVFVTTDSCKNKMKFNMHQKVRQKLVRGLS